MPKDGLIGFRLSKDDKLKFEKKHPSSTMRASVLRALLQMYLKGEIKSVKYIQDLSFN